MSMSDSAALNEIVSVNREVMSGMPVFRGTRVPIEVVIVELAGGASLEEILRITPLSILMMSDGFWLLCPSLRSRGGRREHNGVRG